MLREMHGIRGGVPRHPERRLAVLTASAGFQRLSAVMFVLVAYASLHAATSCALSQTPAFMRSASEFT